MKKILSLILTAALVFSLGVPAFAAEAKGDVTDVEVFETGDSRTAVTSDENYTYTATKNFQTGMFMLTIEDFKTNKVVREVEVDLNNLPELKGDNELAVTAVVSEQDTFTGYYYRIDSDSPHDDWKIRCPKTAHDSMQSRAFVDTYYLYLPYSPANQDYLDEFKDAVEALDDSEKAAVSTVGMALVLEYLTIAAATAAGGPLGAAVAEVLIVSLTGVAAHQVALEEMNDDMNQCYYTWRNAWKYGENRHF